MWGKLSIQHPLDNKLVTTIPQEIELPVSKKTHFIGRIPTPSDPKYYHRVQNFISLPFLSATHCSISVDSTDTQNMKYSLTDLSTNGTFIKRAGSSEEEAELVGNGNNVELFANDQILFKLRGNSNVLCYIFVPMFNAPEVQISKLIALDNCKEGEVAMFKNQLTQLQNELQLSEERLQAVNNKLEKLQEENITLHRHVAQQNDTIDERNAEVTKLKDIMLTYESNLAATEANNRNIKHQIQDLKDSNKNLTSKIDFITEELKHKSDQLSKRVQHIAEINEARCEEINVRKRLEGELEYSRNELNDEKVRNSRLSNSNKLLQQLVYDSDDEVKKQTNKYLSFQTKLRNALQEDRSRRERLMHQLDTIQQSIGVVAAETREEHMHATFLLELQSSDLSPDEQSLPDVKRGEMEDEGNGINTDEYHDGLGATQCDREYVNDNIMNADYNVLDEVALPSSNFYTHIKYNDTQMATGSCNITSDNQIQRPTYSPAQLTSKSDTLLENSNYAAMATSDGRQPSLKIFQSSFTLETNSSVAEPIQEEDENNDKSVIDHNDFVNPNLKCEDLAQDIVADKALIVEVNCDDCDMTQDIEEVPICVQVNQLITDDNLRSNDSTSKRQRLDEPTDGGANILDSEAINNLNKSALESIIVNNSDDNSQVKRNSTVRCDILQFPVESNNEDNQSEFLPSSFPIERGATGETDQPITKIIKNGSLFEPSQASAASNN